MFFLNSEKKSNFFNFKFTVAKFLHNCFGHNLIVYKTIWARYW